MFGNGIYADVIKTGHWVGVKPVWLVKKGRGRLGGAVG